MDYTPIINEHIDSAIEAWEELGFSGITRGDITGRSQASPYTLIRAEAVAAIYATGLLTLAQIGVEFGGRNKAAILYLVRTQEVADEA